MRDSVADVESVYTLGHFISSLISSVAWAIGALLLVKPMKRSPEWRSWHLVSITLVLATVIAPFTLRGALPDGLAQRAGNVLVFSWYVLMSIKLIDLGRRPAAS
jgi:hypothetical protein